MSTSGPGAEGAGPLPDILGEAQRILSIAVKAGVSVRFFGGVAVALRSPSAKIPGLERRYNDLDLAGLSKQRGAVETLLTTIGYEGDRSFNALRGHQRLLFWDHVNGRQVDVLLDRFRMCHSVDFKHRLEVNEQTLPLADLLLFKLQIIQVNEKDITDAITLLGDHPVADHDDGAINSTYIARVTADDWGFYHTVELSLKSMAQQARDHGIPLPYPIDEQVAQILQRMHEEPKSTRWKMRSRVGERSQWYELPEEARS